ncbi:MAG TPA: metallophosphoesterase [Solirubrobacteraceae bacterium]|nr:metallophosphoesterase [Solirubrobacteraceae bacterium]
MDRRRRSLVAAQAGAAALAAWAGWVEPRRLVVRRDELWLRHWPASLDGLRVGVMADLHSGVPHMGRPAIGRAVDRLAAESPDLVLLLGDYLDGSPVFGGRLAPEVVAAELGRFRAPLGTIAVLGNHDWMRGGHRMWSALEREGITVLENRAVSVRARGARLWIAGLADVRHRRANPEGALEAVPPGEPVLVLSHDPDAFPHVPARAALTLSGHLHGGQVAIPLLRRPAIPSWYGERYARRHVVEGGRRLYVSSGLGTSGLPVRLLAPPEVVVLTLRPAG